MKKPNVYIWGTGPAALQIKKTILLDKCNFCGFIDNNSGIWGKEIEGSEIVSYSSIKDKLDYCIVSVKKYQAIIYQLKLTADDKRFVFVFGENKIDETKYYFLKTTELDLLRLQNEYDLYKKIAELKLRNFKYEIEEIPPKVMFYNNEIAIKQIIEKRKSLIRFGDGEFELMAGNERAPFQKLSGDIGKRLKEIIQIENEKLLIAIAKNYGNLEEYTEATANGIRDYMSEEVRNFHYSIIDLKRIYYDAYIFKCYMPYKDKENAINRFKSVKKIWESREIVLIEGKYTRTGFENDLLDNTLSVERILCPTKNAYEKYETILKEASCISKDKLILIALGPAGKILAFDLFKIGYQVIDIGQMDMDYDWFKAGTEFKVPNSKKYISQLPETEIEDVEDEEYLNQIIKIIN